MHSKFVLLLLAALQVSYSSQWERPHIRYCSRNSNQLTPNYCRWEHRQPDYNEDYPSGSNYEDSYHQPLHCEDHCRPHHCSDETKPVHEDQHEDVRSRSEAYLRDEESHISGQSAGGHVYLPRPRHEDCETFVNPNCPPYEGSNDKLPTDESAEGRSAAGRVFLPRPRHEDCEIFVNPIRPPYEGPNDKLPIAAKLLSEHGRGHLSECPSEGIPGEEFQSVAASYPSEVLSSPLRSSVSGGTDQDIQASIAHSAISQQIGADALKAGANRENILLPSSGPIGLTPLLPFPPSGAQPFINQPLIGPSLPLRLVAPTLPSPNFCIRHRLVPVPIQVVEDCITNVPVVRKTVRHQVEIGTRHVPVFEKTVTQQHEKIVRHVPFSGKTLRNVIETRVRHIPVIKSRIRTVVEPYTVHIPVTIRFTRPVEESITKTVPIQEVRVRPVVTKRTRLVQVVERRLRPIVERRIHNVPVKKSYVRTVVEQRVRPVVGPCQPSFVPLQPIGLPMSLIPAEEIPRILLSPYSDIFGGSNGDANSPLAASTAPFGAAISRCPVRSGNDLLSGPINGQISTPCGDHSRIPYCQPIHINSGELSISPSALPTIPPNAEHIIPNLHETGCRPRPPSC